MPSCQRCTALGRDRHHDLLAGVPQGCQQLGSAVLLQQDCLSRGHTPAAGQAVVQAHGGGFFDRIQLHLREVPAITATAHKLARIFYQLWTSGGDYRDPGMDYYEQRYQERVINNLQKKALALGFELVPQPEANTVSLERDRRQIPISFGGMEKELHPN